MKNIEFNLLRIYKPRQGFWLAFFEITNHDTGRSWSLLQIGKDKYGYCVTACGE